MAYYKGREVSIESHIPVDYKVIIVNKDGTTETVDLAAVTLSKKEIVEFVKGEQKRMEDQKNRSEKRDTEYVEEMKINKTPKGEKVEKPVTALVAQKPVGAL